MNIHKVISEKITLFLDVFYFNNLIKIYKKTINDIFLMNNYIIIKPEYFIFAQYYCIYTFLYYLNKKNIIFYSISLQFIHINGLIFNNLIKKYNYIPKYNIFFLNNTSYLLFMYLFYLKMLFLHIKPYKKIFLLSIFSLFYLLLNVNFIYKERLKCIQFKKDFIHPLKILIISPNKIFIENIIKTTENFTYDNFFLIINFFIFILNY